MTYLDASEIRRLVMHEKEMIRRIEAAEAKRRGWVPGFVWGLVVGAAGAFAAVLVVNP